MRIMKLYLLTTLSLLALIIYCCEEPTEPDTTPPTVTITFPQDGATVSEIVTITCVSTDNKGVEKVELWVNGVSTDVTDDTEPYSLDWNTTNFDDGSNTITVRSYDVNDNKSDSAPITLIVDNSGSYPQSVSIISIVFGDGNFTITWNQSTDEDFDSYELEKSVESTMGDYDVIYTTEDVTDTTYVDSDVDPLSYQYYRITVIDTFGYETKGQIVSSSLDPVPTSVNVSSVTYTLTEMTVTWEESHDGDFESYKIFYSETEGGYRDTIVTYTNKSTTSHLLIDFDPTHENWFWILVTDTLGQSSIGNGKSNTIDIPPSHINISSITYDLNEMVINWQQSNESDFFSYELLYSEIEFGEQISIITITDVYTISTTITDFDPTEERWYWINVTDYWGLSSVGNGYMIIDNPPLPSEIDPIIYENNSFYISWSQNSDDDFQYYTLYESFSEDMSGETIIFTTYDGNENEYIVSNVGQDEFRYYRVIVTDVWDLETSSPVMYGSSFPKIVFISDREGERNIYIMDINGGNQTNLTNYLGDYVDLMFSPDGSKIVFRSIRNGYDDIFIMNNDGSNLTNLTDSPGSDVSPHFSPDGSNIVFSSNRDGFFEIYTMNEDGSNQIRLTNTQSNDSPKYSPDGSSIVFRSSRDGNSEIFMMDADGNNQTNLTNHTNYDGSPIFSPNGSKILFITNRDADDWEVYIMDLDGSNQNRLTNSIGFDGFYGLQFSPDGSKIVFHSDRDGNREIYMMDFDGNNQTNLTNNAGADQYPYFSPDGSTIVFNSQRDDNWEIYIMDSNGSNQTNLTINPYDDFSPQFQPRP